VLKPVFVQALVAEAPVEALDVCILDGLSGLDEVQSHAPITRPAKHREGLSIHMLREVAIAGRSPGDFMGKPPILWAAAVLWAKPIRA
jgi:hypothetical protein